MLQKEEGWMGNNCNKATGNRGINAVTRRTEISLISCLCLHLAKSSWKQKAKKRWSLGAKSLLGVNTFEVREMEQD